MGKWKIIYKSDYPNQGELRCECDKCEHITHGVYRDFRFGDTLHYELPKFCSNCGDKKDNTYVLA